jgi:LemA protein
MAKNKKMPTWAYVLIGILVFSILVFSWVAGSYNSLVTFDEGVNNAWGNVQTAYQRRADLIPNLVSTVQASAEFESNLLEKVTQFRAGIRSAETPNDMEILGQEINSAINLAFEAYPNIKTTDAFLDLQVQLEGTENRIKVERDNYNKAVRLLNTKVRKFPSNTIASMFNFDQRDYFESDSGSENAPNVGELFN